MVHMTCVNKSPTIPECDDSDLEARVEALEECCEEVHTELDNKADADEINTELESIRAELNTLIAGWHYVGEVEDEESLPTTLTEGEVYYSLEDNGFYVAVSDDPNNGWRFISGVKSAITPIHLEDGVISHDDSGVTAGTYGDTTNQTPDFGETFKAVSATVDSKGHVTSISEHTVELPDPYDIYDTKCGDIVTIDDAEEARVKSLTVSLSPVQAGTPFLSVQAALNVNRYGVKWDMVNAQMTRTLDAEGVTTNLTNFRHWGSVNASYDNPFDSIYPWSDRKLCNIDIDAYRSLQSGQSIKDCVTYWEGDAGFDYNDNYGVWVYTPEFWARSYIEDGCRYFEIATNALTDYLYYEESICGRYLGCDVTLTIDGTSKHCNLPTVGMPMANVSMANMHTYAKNWGATINDIYSIDRVSTLYLVEMANMNLQNSIGGGVSNLYVQTLHPSSASTGNTVTFSGLTSAQLSHIIPNAIVDLGTSDGGMQIKRTYITAVSTSGTTTTVTLAESVTVDTSTFFSVHGLINIADSEIGSKSGFIGANTKANAYYRGQTFYANKYQYILGAYRQQNTGEIWIANKGESDNYDALDTSIHIDTGNALTQASGYIQTLGMADELSFAPFCTGVGGNATNPVGDYCYVPALSTVNTCLLLGGSSGSGAGCGLSGSWSNTAGHSSWSIGSSPSLITP